MNHIEIPDNITPIQLWEDYKSWIRGHTNLYNCLIKMKHFIVNNLLFIIYIYAIYKIFI
jgi:hypothetical protein